MKKLTIKTTKVTRNRAKTLTPKDYNYIYFVYNGKLSTQVVVEKNILGTKLGAFSPTKKLGKSIHDSERNRKKKLKKKGKK